MKYPVFISECGGDLMPFISLLELRQQLELIDIKEGVYDAYDSEGRLLKFVVAQHETTEKTFFGKEKKIQYEIFHLEDAESIPSHAEELRKMLQEAFETWRSPEWIEKATLPELVNEILFFFKKNRDS